MLSSIKSIARWISGLFVSPPVENAFSWQAPWSEFLLTHVTFYRGLSVADRQTFEQRCLLFLNTTRIEAGAFEVTMEDRLLVAASAIIPVAYSTEDDHRRQLNVITFSS